MSDHDLRVLSDNLQRRLARLESDLQTARAKGDQRWEEQVLDAMTDARSRHAERTSRIRAKSASTAEPTDAAKLLTVVNNDAVKPDKPVAMTPEIEAMFAMANKTIAERERLAARLGLSAEDIAEFGDDACAIVHGKVVRR